ncbi:hypothetical protein [Exiguobacterium acetylicum]|nr:hypothetical protein [Exiguobacterium acetylicum]
MWESTRSSSDIDVGYEKATNWALQAEDETAFIKELTTDQPEPPNYSR